MRVPGALFRLNRAWAPTLALALLAGCARPEPIVLRPPPGPPSGIDGRYRGTARLVRADSRFCPRSGPRVYEVENGSVTLAYSTAQRPNQRPERVPLTATVQQDGRIQASDGTGTLEGQLRDGLLEVTIGSTLCEHRWTMRKVP